MTWPATPGPGITYTPIAMTHVTVSPGARFELPWDPEFNALAYVLAGRGTVGPEARAGAHRSAGRVRRR